VYIVLYILCSLLLHSFCSHPASLSNVRSKSVEINIFFFISHGVASYKHNCTRAFVFVFVCVSNSKTTMAHIRRDPTFFYSCTYRYRIFLSNHAHYDDITKFLPFAYVLLFYTDTVRLHETRYTQS
jgi:hypothetical protein